MELSMSLPISIRLKGLTLKELSMSLLTSIRLKG
jgi:hypothetical protein